MEDKYYVPTIEEFRVGFRYEFLENHGSLNQEYVSKTIKCISDGEDDLYLGDTLKSIENCNNVFIRNTFRVRYLDEFDILELGFVKVKETNYQKLLNNGNFYEITYDEDGLVIELWKKKDNTLYDCFTLFKGQVKNYNELEVILKQIGI